MNNYYNPYNGMGTYYGNRDGRYGGDGRFGGFFVPFVLGGLVGGAAVGVSRPRPVVVTPGPGGGYPYPPYQPYPPYYPPFRPF